MTHLGGVQRYGYDANGNMTTRWWNGATQSLSYDVENRLTGVSGSGAATFVYDGEGNRVKGAVNGTTTLYMGTGFEWSGGAGTSYYYFGGLRVALRANGQTSYIHGDHLTSATNTTGSQAKGPQRYYPYGETRGSVTVETPYRYTGQREEAGIGLYYYGARWYDPALGRFIQPDTIVPEPGDPQSLNRYSYCLNNPLTYVDRDGHVAVLLIVGAVILVAKAIDYGWTAWDSYQSLKVMNDPYASEAAKNEAAANLAMTVACELVEPDDLLPIALPLDDLARKGVVKLGSNVSQSIAQSGHRLNKTVRIAEKLSKGAKKQIRSEAADIFYKANPTLAKRGLQVHHRIPLEWAHLFPDANPNRLSNLIGLGQAHAEINKRWDSFRHLYQSLGREPTASEVMQFAAQLDNEFSTLFNKVTDWE